jgi:hypothetical protein
MIVTTIISMSVRPWLERSEAIAPEENLDRTPADLTVPGPMNAFSVTSMP